MKPFEYPQIISWYKKNGRHDLPWRDYDHDAQTLLYRVWAAEIMLQQTQAIRVVEYYNRFLGAYPTLSDLTAVSWEEFFPYYE